jgi:hypothetical protein
MPLAEQAGHAGPNVGHDVGAVELALQVLLGRIEFAEGRLRIATGGVRQQGALQCCHVLLDGRHHVRAIGCEAQVARVCPTRGDAQPSECGRQEQRHQNDGEDFPANGPIADCPPRRTLALPSRSRGEVGGASAVGLIDERSHRDPAELPVARWHFIDRASSMRLSAGVARQSVEYDSDVRAFLQFLLNRQSS